jgi:hypothetical protein
MFNLCFLIILDFDDDDDDETACDEIFEVPLTDERIVNK